MSFKTRLQKLRQGLAEKEIDAIFISQPDNRYYLSGFSGSAGYLLITSQQATLATDFRYLELAQAQSPDYEIFRIISDAAEWFPQITEGLGAARLGFEARHMTFAMYQKLSEIVKDTGSRIELVPIDGLVELLRAVKEPEELELITRATKLTDAVFENIETLVGVGKSELEVAWGIERFFRENGSQSLPFEVIAASGPNSAIPHAQPSARQIRPNEPVVIDIGARIDGYSSDLTRTFFFGTPDATYKKIYNTVLEAQREAIAGIAEGMSGEHADGIARKVIEKAGYGEAFGHGVGHGIGLVVHELPRVGPKSTDVLTPGMVFTVEPGIYLSGWGGVRIEDDIVIENGKARVISTARKGL